MQENRQRKSSVEDMLKIDLGCDISPSGNKKPEVSLPRQPNANVWHDDVQISGKMEKNKKGEEALCTLPFTHNPDDEDEEVLDHICGIIRRRFMRSFWGLTRPSRRLKLSKLKEKGKKKKERKKILGKKSCTEVFPRIIVFA